MELENEQNIVTDILTDLINDISYPPVSPTLTKDLLVEKLKEAKKIIENVSFTDGEDEPSGIDSSDLDDLKTDIDDARSNIVWMNEELEKDPDLKTEEHRNRFLDYFRDLESSIDDANGELIWLL